MRILVLAAAVLSLSACWIWEDEPQYVFQVLTVAEGEEPVAFAVQPRNNGLILVGPFVARCSNALISGDVSESDRALRLIVRARGCEGEDEPTAYDYELVWSGIDEGTYSLTVRHENQAGAPDGIVFAETIAVQ